MRAHRAQRMLKRMSTNVVIAGGGVAALEALLALSADAGPLVDVTLVADTDTFTYRSLQVGEAFGADAARRYPLASLARGATFLQRAIRSVAIGERELLLDDGSRLAYDALLLTTGARSVPAFDHGVTFTPAAMEEILDDLRAQLAGDVTIVVPRGAAWSLPAYELALMTAASNRKVTVRVVTHESRPLDIFGDEAASAVLDVLHAAGV